MKLDQLNVSFVEASVNKPRQIEFAVGDVWLDENEIIGMFKIIRGEKPDDDWKDKACDKWLEEHNRYSYKLIIKHVGTIHNLLLTDAQVSYIEKLLNHETRKVRQV